MTGNQRPGLASVLLRTLPESSVLHHLWAGTKILGVALLTLVVSLFPGWPAVAIGAGLVVLAAILAKIPRGALPHLPWWLWLSVVVGLALSLLGSGLTEYLQFLALSWILVAISMILAWTTPMSELAPAMAQLLAPLRRLRLPVQEWTVAIALCVRSLPLLSEELRVVVAARRLRSTGGRRTPRGLISDGIGVLAAAMAAAIRRADDMGQAIAARGGTGQLTARVIRPGRRDVFALSTLALANAAIVAVTLFGFPDVVVGLFPAGEFELAAAAGEASHGDEGPG